MSSSEGNADDVASSCNTHLPRQSDKGISESTFRQMLVDFARWYDGLGYINMLKVLYRDHVPIFNELNEATEVMSLLRMLIGSGNLSSNNLTILYDTIIVTGQFGFKSISLLPSFQSIKEREVSKFTRHRQKLMRLGMALTRDDIKTLDGLYNMPLLINYRDSWSLILDLEQRMELCEGKMDEFIEALPSNGLAEKALREGNDEGVVPTCTSHSPRQPNEEVGPLISTMRQLEIQRKQDAIIRECLFTQQQKCYNTRQFTPAIWCNRYQVDIATMFTDVELLKKYRYPLNDIPTTLEEVLDVVKFSPECKVLIEGETGIGKSTLLRYVAYNWASNKSDETFKGKIVFLVNIRDINTDETILDTILKQIDPKELFGNTNLPNEPKLIKQFIMNHDDEIVLLLDGLDELRDGSENPIIYFEKRKMKRSKVMLTSRSEQIDVFIKMSSVHVEVKGFSIHNIRKYIMKHFDYIEMPELGDSLVWTLESEEILKQYSNVNPMCKNPMFLLAICNMWEERQYIPNDKADLSKEIFICIFNQFNKQESNGQKVSKFEDIPNKFVDAMLVLGKCMFDGLKVNQLYINKTHLEGDKEIVDLALKLGFVYKEAPRSKADFEIIFTASHKFIVESLVGFYLYKLSQAVGLENGSADEIGNVLKPLSQLDWRIIRESEHLHMVRILAVQFLGGNAAMFLNHWITNSLSTYRMLMQYLKHVAEEHREAVEKALIDYMSKTELKIKPHISDVCNSLKKFIHHISPTVEVNEDEHFIKLMRMIHDVLSEGHIPLQNLFENLCTGRPAKEKGRLCAHMLIAIPNQQSVFKEVQNLLTVDDVKHLTTECQRFGIKFEITDCRVCGASVTTSYLVYVLSNAPQLKEIWLEKTLGCRQFIGKTNSWYYRMKHNINRCDCRISGSIMNDTIEECSRKGVKLELRILSLIDTNTDGFSLASLMVIAPKLYFLYMHNCGLSGSIMNDMVRECLGRGVNLEVEAIHFEDNNFSNIDGSSLADLMSIAPKLGYFYLVNCNLSSIIMNDMIRECSRRGEKLKLLYLYMEGNNFSDIDGSSLADLLCIAPKLNHLHMSNCSLSGVIINDMIRECSKRGVKLDLRNLYLRGNDLSDIDGSSLASLMTMAPDLESLCINNCRLSDVVLDGLIRECSTRGIELKL